MELTIGYRYKKLSTGLVYVLTEIERGKKDMFVYLDGPHNTARRVEAVVFKRDYKKVRVSKKIDP